MESTADARHGFAFCHHTKLAVDDAKVFHAVTVDGRARRIPVPDWLRGAELAVDVQYEARRVATAIGAIGGRAR